MTHARQRIVDAAVTALRASPLLSAAGVAGGASFALERQDPPAVRVLARVETIDLGNSELGMAPGVGLRDRVLQLQIVAILKDDNDDDTAANEYAAEIEESIERGRGELDSIVDLLQLESTTITANADQERPIRVVELRYTMAYRTRAGYPREFA